MKSRLKLPLGWRSSQLDEVADVILSNVDKKSYDDQIPVRLCNYTDVYYNDKIINGLDFMEATATDREVERFKIHPGDVLITKDSETPDDIAVPALVEDAFDDVLCGYHLAILRPDSTAVSGAYLSFLLGLHWVRHYFFTLANGVTRYGLTSDAIQKAVLPFPPLPEQKKIAEILSTWDDAIATVSRLIESKRALKKGLMQQLLTGKRRFPGFTKPWTRTKLREITSMIRNGAVYDIKTRIGYPMTRIETISNWVIDFDKVGHADPDAKLNEYKLKKGDILYSHINSLKHIGKVAIYKGGPDLYHGMNLLLIRPNTGVIAQYLYLLFTSVKGRRFAIRYAKQAVNQASINSSEVASFTFDLPDISEQMRIVDLIDMVDKELEMSTEHLSKLCAEKRGLMQKLLTGQVRVKVDEEVSG